MERWAIVLIRSIGISITLRFPLLGYFSNHDDDDDEDVQRRRSSRTFG